MFVSADWLLFGLKALFSSHYRIQDIKNVVVFLDKTKLLEKEKKASFIPFKHNVLQSTEIYLMLYLLHMLAQPNLAGNDTAR